MSRHYLPILLVLASLGCDAKPAADAAAATTPAAAAPDTAAIRATITSTEKQYSEAYKKGDGAAVAALYSTDAASVPAQGEWSRGRDAIAKQNQTTLDAVTVDTREDVPEEVTVMGDHAVEIGHYAWTGKAKKGGAARGEAGRYMALWHKDTDGTWRLSRDIAAVAAPAKK